MIDLWPFLILSFAASRLVRFVVYDSLIGSHLESGTKWSKKLDRFGFTDEGQDRVWWRSKPAILLSCPWCVGAYCSLLAVCLYVWEWPWDLTAREWVTAWAVMWCQALMNVAEHKWLSN